MCASMQSYVIFEESGLRKWRKLTCPLFLSLRFCSHSACFLVVLVDGSLSLLILAGVLGDRGVCVITTLIGYADLDLGFSNIILHAHRCNSSHALSPNFMFVWQRLGHLFDWSKRWFLA